MDIVHIRKLAEIDQQGHSPSKHYYQFVVCLTLARKTRELGFTHTRCCKKNVLEILPHLSKPLERHQGLNSYLVYHCISWAITALNPKPKERPSIQEEVRYPIWSGTDDYRRWGTPISEPCIPITCTKQEFCSFGKPVTRRLSWHTETHTDTWRLSHSARSYCWLPSTHRTYKHNILVSSLTPNFQVKLSFWQFKNKTSNKLTVPSPCVSKRSNARYIQSVKNISSSWGERFK